MQVYCVQRKGQQRLEESASCFQSWISPKVYPGPGHHPPSHLENFCSRFKRPDDLCEAFQL